MKSKSFRIEVVMPNKMCVCTEKSVESDITRFVEAVFWFCHYNTKIRLLEGLLRQI